MVGERLPSPGRWLGRTDSGRLARSDPGGPTVTVRFMIRQHGKIPSPGPSRWLRPTRVESGERLQFAAVELADPGHYEVTLELPQAGTWRWTIDGFGEHPQPDLTVSPTAVAVAPRQPEMPILWLLTGLGAAILVGALVYQSSKPGKLSPWAWSVLVLPLLAAGLLVINTQAQSQPLPAQASLEAGDAYAQGEALFIAKGCVTCHRNDRVPGRYVSDQVAIGPDLTDHPQSAEFLRSWLQDPRPSQIPRCRPWV